MNDKSKEPFLGKQDNWFKKDMPHYFRLKKYLELLDGLIKENDRVLDIGCGEGYLLSLLPPCQRYGIDIERIYLQRARKVNPGGHFQLASADKLPFRKNFFDWVFCTEVIEHLANPKKCLQETKRVLKPNGHFLVSTYNHYNIFNLLTGRAFSKKPRFPEAHKREYSWSSFKREIGKFFIIIKTSQAASTDLFQRLITLAKMPVGDFIIILSKN